MSTEINELEKQANGNGEAETIVPRREASVMEIAAVIAGSRDFPECRTPEKAAVRILAGKEMGVGPVASVIGIRVQSGRVSMDATLMAGCIKRSGIYDYTIETHTDAVCCLKFTENGKVVGLSTFAWEDAEKAGLHKKQTWKEYPRNMLFARALSNGARWYCPGIFGGAVYTHEELGYAVDAEGRATEAEPGAGGELCTRDQRQEINRLIGLLGRPVAAYLADLGIKLLDELSCFEADKEIKRLQKQLDKRGEVAVASVTVAPNEPVKCETLTPAQEMIAEAFADAAKPSTARQREQILALAEKLEPEEDACIEMMRTILAKRGKKKISELDYLAASALIESMTEKVMRAPPFDPTPNAGK